MRKSLFAGLAIPACPLALNDERKFDERHQRALIRYYAAAGAGGVAVGVHTTQFAIRDPQVGLFEPVLRLAAEELDRAETANPASPMVRVGGICGDTPQAIREATLLQDCGYHCGLLSLGALRDATEDQLIEHCRAVAEVIPVFGFYLQPSVGGRLLPVSFWRRFFELPNVVAVKVAAFNRYQTLDVVRALAESGRDDVALYTGNDDNIVLDLVTPYRFRVGEREVTLRFSGGLLGHWAVWTQKAAEILKRCREVANSGGPVPEEILRLNGEVTDCNAAFFDAANGFAGCIAGIHEILHRQGLLARTWCLDPGEGLSPGQREEIDRACRAYPHLSDDSFAATRPDARQRRNHPHLSDDSFVAEHLDEWLR